MARLPRRQGVFATALQGGRPQRGVVRRLLQSASALGGGAIDLLRRIWRWILSRIGRRPCVAARMAKKTWRHDEPARGPLLRRAVARARGAIQDILVPGTRALAFLRDLPQRALAFVVDLLQRLVPDFVRRQLHPRQPRPPRQPETLLPQPPPPTPMRKTNFAWIYGDPPLPPASTTPPSPPSPPSPPPPPPLILDGEVISKEEQNQYADYCTAARACPAKSKLCHLCFFVMERSKDCIVHTKEMIWHCTYIHKEDGLDEAVWCGKVGCMIQVPSARDLSLHTHFCHSPC